MMLSLGDIRGAAAPVFDVTSIAAKSARNMQGMWKRRAGASFELSAARKIKTSATSDTAVGGCELAKRPSFS